MFRILYSCHSLWQKVNCFCTAVSDVILDWLGCVYCFRYNSLEQLVCTLCNMVIKSNNLWVAHIQGNKHREVKYATDYYLYYNILYICFLIVIFSFTGLPIIGKIMNFSKKWNCISVYNSFSEFVNLKVAPEKWKFARKSTKQWQKCKTECQSIPL